jgi:mRNA-degrading endonuclease toxin of MazEF toxin-antitoxin module
LKTSDIKVGHIYYVDYEPVRDCEFNGLHLSLVLKKNNDKHTFIVMPLTSSAKLPLSRRISKRKIHTLFTIRCVP